MNASYKTAIKYKDFHISVKMLKVSHDSSIELNQLCKDSKERVRYRKYCPSCDKEITNEDIVRGYQYTASPAKYIVLSEDEINSLKSEEDSYLTIRYFCKSREISDLLIDKQYYLIPEMDSEKEYSLFRKALISNRVVAIAEIVLGTKQELVALFANKDCIVASILFYENEINELPIMFKRKISKDDTEELKAYITEDTKSFDWQSHFDKFQLRLRELIVSKIPK